MNAVTTLIADVDHLAAAVRAACAATDLDEVAAQAAPLGDVVGRLGAVYDSIAERLYADGCPGRHATDDFALAADHLHAAGAACRYAHQRLVEAIDTGRCR